MNKKPIRPVFSLANKITIARILLIPVFMTFLLSKGVLNALSINIEWGVAIAGVIFVVAALTDSLDGYLARVRGEITEFGQLLDPLADKLLISAALVSLIGLGRLSPWIAMIIIGREFAVMGFRMTASVKHVSIPSSKLGKLKTISQSFAVASLMFTLPWTTVQTGIVWTLFTLAIGLTIASGLEYFTRYWSLLFEDNSNGHSERNENKNGHSERNEEFRG